MCSRFVRVTFCLIFVTISTCVSYTEDNTLCNFMKTSSKCACTYEKDKRTGNPLYSMDCAKLKLEKVPSTKEVTGIERLDLSFNAIEKLDGNVNNVESSNLIILDLSYNNIYYIGDSYFQNLDNLEVLDLSHNRISSFVNGNVFNGLKKLKTLNLGYNSISTLPDYIFSPLSSLTELDISYNYCGYIFKNKNNIFNMSIGITKNINKLNMDNLDIHYIPHSFFEGGKKLTYLSMADNPMLEIPTIPYTIAYLDLSGTLISVLAGKYLNYHSLKVLKLNRLSALHRIDHYAFYNLQSLEELQLNDNHKLSDLNSLAFGILSKTTDVQLKKLSVARSGLKTLNYTYRYLFEELDHINLEDNPFVCNCSILWMQEFNDYFHKPYNLRCKAPARLWMKSVTELTFSDLPDCMPDEHHRQKLIITILSILIALLIVFILYLIYVGPLYYQNKYRGIGPESPYNNTLDIRPERAEEPSTQ